MTSPNIPASPVQQKEDAKATGQILKSTTIIGGSSLINVIFRVLQAKAVAVMVGPGGVGLIGVFNSITGLAGTISGMGIATSGVPEIAAAAQQDDSNVLAEKVVIFRRLTILLGVTGAVIFFLARRQIASFTFESQEHVEALGLLALIPLFTVLMAGQSGLIRAMRRIKDLAKVSIFGISSGTILGLPLLWLLGEDGIAYYLVTVAGSTLFVSWWYARGIKTAKPQVSIDSMLDNSKRMLGLGFSFMISGFVNLASIYIVKVLVVRHLGLEAAGYFEASSMLANVYVGFILGAMGADFFPHLASLSDNDPASVRLINSQVSIGILLAGPGLLAILAFGPFVLQLLYSPEFIPAFDILRWQVLGTFLRVLTWPLSYLILARGKGWLYFFTESTVNIVYVGLVALFLIVAERDVAAVGVAFFVMYIFYFGVTTLVAKNLVAFHWSNDLLPQIAVFLPISLLVFGTTLLDNGFAAMSVGFVAAAVTGIFAVRRLSTITGIPISKDWLLQKLRSR